MEKLNILLLIKEILMLKQAEKNMSQKVNTKKILLREIEALKEVNLVLVLV